MPTKIFFCEPIGQLFFVELYICANGHRHEVDRGKFAEERRPENDWGATHACPKCDLVATLDTISSGPIFRRPDTGEEYGRARSLPAGAVYDAPHYRRYNPPRTGDDGRSLVVVLPNGRHWCIDGRASNCTCQTIMCIDAGCGISAGNYHGFLHHGVLTDGC